MSEDRPEDLFDVFEPWSEPEARPSARAPSAPREPRRRVGPRIPPPRPKPIVPDASGDPAAFLRAVGIPEIRRIERRLRAADHQLRIQDLLDLPDPALRLLFWPGAGPMDIESVLRGTLEFLIRWGDTGGLTGAEAAAAKLDGARVVARFWSGPDPSGSAELCVGTLDALDGAWLRLRILDFVETMLSRS